MNKGNIFDYINEQVDIVDVISSYVSLNRAGKNYKALCPFHNEKTPSFIVSEEKQLFHCFGCGAAGNTVGFIMQYENLDAIDAVEFLANRYNVDISEFKKNGQGKNYRQQAHYYDILRDAAIFFYKNLRKHPDALNYLERRGIDYDLIKKFGIGFSSDAWATLIKTLSGKYSPDALEKVGLVIHNKEKDRYYDRFRNRVMFPIINPQGRIIGFGGRVMDDALPKYLNSPESEVFNKSRTLYGLNIAKNYKGDKRQLIITEGYMDVIALHASGFGNAVATLGTALTKEHARLVKRYADEVILCYDSDSAGQNAALKGLDVLEGVIEHVKVIKLGEGLDPDDFIKKHGREAFQEKIDGAVSGTTFRIDRLMGHYNLSDDASKIEFLSKAAAIVRKLENGFEKNLHIERLGTLLGVNTDLIAREVLEDQYREKAHYGFHSKATQIPKVGSDRRVHLEEQLLVYWVQLSDQLTEEQRNFIETFSYSQGTVPIYDSIMRHWTEYGGFNKERFIEEADITASTQLVNWLEKHAVTYDAFDFELIVYNLTIMALDDDIEHLKLALKESNDKAAVQKRIHEKILAKQQLTMKMPRRKLNN